MYEIHYTFEDSLGNVTFHPTQSPNLVKYTLTLSLLPVLESPAHTPLYTVCYATGPVLGGF